MKKLIVVLVAVGICGFVMPAQAQDDVLPPGANRPLIIENLVIGLKTDNAGLQRSCALMLGQIYAEEADIPLMFAMRNDNDAEVRIAAAWALCRIGGKVGTYIVKHQARFEDNQLVQAHQAFYYDTYVQKGVFKIVDIQVPAISELFTPVPVTSL